jgi:membrane-bound inhibitor of C-type lysozyme
VSQFRAFLCFFVVSTVHLVTSQTTQPSTPWQRLEFRCANDVLLTQVVASPGQLTLIFKDAFYLMKQVEDSSTMLRYEDGKNLFWMMEGDVGRLEQNDGKVLAEGCMVQPETRILGYICIDDVTVEVEYRDNVAHISVVDPLYGDQSYNLSKVASTLGAKFSNGLTTWFVAGEEANLFEETEEVQHAQNCKLQKD